MCSSWYQNEVEWNANVFKTIFLAVKTNWCCPLFKFNVLYADSYQMFCFWFTKHYTKLAVHQQVKRILKASTLLKLGSHVWSKPKFMPWNLKNPLFLKGLKLTWLLYKNVCQSALSPYLSLSKKRMKVCNQGWMYIRQDELNLILISSSLARVYVEEAFGRPFDQGDTGGRGQWA